MLKIDKNSKIYIVAPANLATGGPELLHQLGYQLKNEYDVYMYYYPNNANKKVHDNYKKYNIKISNKIEDSDENYIIVPETKTELLFNYSSINKIIWWLSVDNYFLGSKHIKRFINEFILKYLNSQNYKWFNKKLSYSFIHFAQSEYAINFLESKGINNIYKLYDYLHDDLIKKGIQNDNKKNVVLYNPKKGFKFTKKLIEYAPHVNFKPLINMTRDEMSIALSEAKIYIDFGYHPGKDRIPREAAMSGCCVFTNLKGSAKNNIDVPIPQYYKIEDNDKNIEEIISRLEFCLDNYDVESSKFNSYREVISKQHNEFIQQLNGIFKING